MKKNLSGFTIVELLIVVVVIAILAAITIVSYNGIQQRSTNATVQSAVSQVIKSVRGYLATESTYPHTGRSCAVSSPCYYGSLVNVNATYQANVAKIGSMPGGVPTWHGTSYGGVIYDYSALRTYNGVPSPLVILYFLKGASQNCEREVAAATLSDTLTTSAVPYTQIVGSTTICVAPIQGM